MNPLAAVQRGIGKQSFLQLADYLLQEGLIRQLPEKPPMAD
jgi:hypothetical protein